MEVWLETFLGNEEIVCFIFNYLLQALKMALKKCQAERRTN